MSVSDLKPEASSHESVMLGNVLTLMAMDASEGLNMPSCAELIRRRLKSNEHAANCYPVLVAALKAIVESPALRDICDDAECGCKSSQPIIAAREALALAESSGTT